MGRRDRREAEHQLRLAIELAATDLSRIAEELQQITKNLPFTARRTAPHLESLAFRLDAAAAGLTAELRGDIDSGSVRWITKYSKHVLAGVVGVAGSLVLGAAQGVGTEATASFLNTARAERQLVAVEQGADELDASGDGPSADRDPGEEVPVPRDSSERIFTPMHAAELAGVSYRQLDYWVRTGLVEPTIIHDDESVPPLARRRFSYNTVLRMKVIKALLDLGVELSKVRTTVDQLSEYPLDTGFLLIDTGSIYIPVDDDRHISDLLNESPSTKVLALSPLKKELDADL